MGKKKAGGPEPINVKLPPQFWCYYCDIRVEDEYKLIQHQRSKHFLCKLCDPKAYGRNCLSLGGLVSHVRRSHRKEIKEVPNAIPGRESLDVEVSAMNGIPEEARREFEEKLAEEMLQARRDAEAGVSTQAAEPASFDKFDEASYRNFSAAEEHAPVPPEPEFAPLPEESGTPVHTPVLPHLAEMASRLTQQLQKQTAVVLEAAAPTPAPAFSLFNNINPVASAMSAGSSSGPAAFDPAALAARIAAAQQAEAREAEEKGKDEKEREERSRRGEPPPARRPPDDSGSRSAPPAPKKVSSTLRTKLMAMEEGAVLKYAMDVGVPEQQIESVVDAKDAKAAIVESILELEAKEAWMTVTFKAGKLGITADWATGYVERTTTNEQAEKNGIKAGMTIKTINGQQYTKSLLQEKIGGKRDYKVMFAQPPDLVRARDERRAARSRSRKPYRSRSRRPQKGSLKFRPRSMNRSPEKQQQRDTQNEDRQEARNAQKKTDEDGRRKDYQSRRDEDRKGDDRRRDDRDRDDDRRGGRGDDRRGGRDDDRRKRDRSRSEKKRDTGWGADAEPEMPMPPQVGQMPAVAAMPQGMPGSVLKNEMCMAFTEGLCTKGEMCPYAHHLRDLAPGGFKPRLCPSFMRGGCPRAGNCMYAHTKEDLPPNFKCIPCQNYSTGFCRKQHICPFAHGAEEQKWFTEFMSISAEEAAKTAAKGQGPNVGGFAVPKPAGLVGEMSMADNVFAAAERQLVQGVNIAGQLDAPSVPKAKAKPPATPKLNLAGNPALRAQAPPNAVPKGMPDGAMAKSGGPPGMPFGAVAKGAPPGGPW